jgi:ribose transport system permease protein
LKYLPSGRRLYALGGDRDSAEVMGIYPRQVVPLAFGLSGLLMGLAGLLEAGRFGQVQTNVGVGDELKFIAAAVIGGTHIMGGRGSALGTLLGAMLIGIMTHMLGLARVSAYWEGVVVGAMILLALGTDVLLSRHSGKAL